MKIASHREFFFIEKDVGVKLTYRAYNISLKSYNDNIHYLVVLPSVLSSLKFLANVTRLNLRKRKKLTVKGGEQLNFNF